MILFFNLPKIIKKFSNMSLFLYLSCISVGQYYQKTLAKSRGLGQNIKKGSLYRGVVYRWGIQTSWVQILRGWKGEPWGSELLGGPKLEKVPDLKRDTSGCSSYHYIVIHNKIFISKLLQLKKHLQLKCNKLLWVFHRSYVIRIVRAMFMKMFLQMLMFLKWKF